MLVALFNAVKVESVPLNSDFFRAAARRTAIFATGLVIGHPGDGACKDVSACSWHGLAVSRSWRASGPLPHAATDEDQVRAVLNGMNGSYNSSDFKEFAAHLCADMLRTAGFEAGWYASRKSDGTDSDHYQLGQGDRRLTPSPTSDSRPQTTRIPRPSTSNFFARAPSGKPAATTSAGTYSSIRAD